MVVERKWRNQARTYSALVWNVKDKSRQRVKMHLLSFLLYLGSDYSRLLQQNIPECTTQKHQNFISFNARLSSAGLYLVMVWSVLHEGVFLLCLHVAEWGWLAPWTRFGRNASHVCGSTTLRTPWQISYLLRLSYWGGVWERDGHWEYSSALHTLCVIHWISKWRNKEEKLWESVICAHLNMLGIQHIYKCVIYRID